MEALLKVWEIVEAAGNEDGKGSATKPGENDPFLDVNGGKGGADQGEVAMSGAAAAVVVTLRNRERIVFHGLCLL